MKKAIEDANININDIDAVACTYGPGLVGALLVGVSYAKALSYALNKPLVAVNHIKGHIAANYITHEELEPPFLCMIMSGGNTQIILVKDYNTFEVLGKTKDDAVGEAFDKVARVIGLGYPGGPKIDKLAKQGQANINLPKTHFDSLNFSFSGIKTAVINLHHKNPDVSREDLCMSFEKAVTEVLIENITKAIEQWQPSFAAFVSSCKCFTPRSVGASGNNPIPGCKSSASVQPFTSVRNLSPSLSM